MQHRHGEMLEDTATLARWAGAVEGTVLLFRSGEEPTGPLLAPEMGWPEMLGRPAHVEVIPGGHREIFNLPGAREIAARARQMLGLDPFVETGSDRVGTVATASEKPRAGRQWGER